AVFGMVLAACGSGGSSTHSFELGDRVTVELSASSWHGVESDHQTDLFFLPDGVDYTAEEVSEVLGPFVQVIMTAQTRPSRDTAAPTPRLDTDLDVNWVAVGIDDSDTAQWHQIVAAYGMEETGDD